MAECLETVLEAKANWKGYEENFSQQLEEVDVLKSFYDTTDNFDVFEDASIDEGIVYSLQFKIKVDIKPDSEAQLWLPIDQANSCSFDSQSTTSLATEFQCEHDEPTTSPKSNNTSDTDTVPRLERSISGKRAFTTIKCSYLPPLLLDIKLPVSYPSETMPNYELTCMWLSKSQLMDLCAKLDELWRENEHMAIIFVWIDWLKSNLLEYLDLCDTQKPNMIVITPLNNYFDYNEKDDNKIDRRAICSYTDSDSFIYEFLRHNYVEEMQEFRRTMQNCLICFDEKLGEEFYRLDKCRHHFCADCMRSMCQMHVREGTIQLLSCPEKNCDRHVTIDIMQSVLTDDEFERWERLLFQRTLDTMEDIIYCSRCSNPITIDKDNTHAFCMYCCYDYCKECKDTWHIGPCVAPEQKMENKLKQHNLTSKELLEMTDEQIKNLFRNSASIIDLRAKIVKTKEETCADYLLRNYLKCLKCGAFIEKIDGCNKVTCRCGAYSCWICRQLIKGYEHFQGNISCNLWQNTLAPIRPPRPIHQGQQALNRILQLVPDQQKNLANCPMCGQRCLKRERNNHLKCWLCNTNFCFCCKKRIVGIVTNHFKVGSTCKQHSD